jgi:hypothetical protein
MFWTPTLFDVAVMLLMLFSHSHNTTTAALCSDNNPIVVASFQVILLANQLATSPSWFSQSFGRIPTKQSSAFSLAFHTIVVVLDVFDLQSLLE